MLFDCLMFKFNSESMCPVMKHLRVPTMSLMLAVIVTWAVYHPCLKARASRLVGGLPASPNQALGVYTCFSIPVESSHQFCL